ncbi:MAG: FadR/GntR family transcriptional regulator [Gaiellaceae bacterium]
MATPDLTSSRRPLSEPPRGSGLAALILAEGERTGARPGTRLPTERQLAQELGVTRAAVRHALALLEAAGRISREVGRGTFLREAVGAPAAESGGHPETDDFGPADVISARELIEPLVLPLVVARATGRDFAELDRGLRTGDAAVSAADFETSDYAFHHAIVAAAHNPLLLRMYAPIEAARHGSLWGNLKRSHDSPERRALYQRDHHEIVEALRARELDRALTATRVHLERVRMNLLGTTERE